MSKQLLTHRVTIRGNGSDAFFNKLRSILPVEKVQVQKVDFVRVSFKRFEDRSVIQGQLVLRSQWK